MATMDGVVTHYYLPDRRPFLNLSDLDDAALAPVLAGLNGSRKDGLQFRPWPTEAFIEVQLWCDAPVRRYLS